jgi:hypothetical protein
MLSSSSELVMDVRNFLLAHKLEQVIMVGVAEARWDIDSWFRACPMCAQNCA